MIFPEANEDLASIDRENSIPVVVLVGRPNVGKSLLFNRLLRKRKAIVDPSPGVTRDWNDALTDWKGKPYRLVDTGGFEVTSCPGMDPAEINEKVWAKTMEAISDASHVIVLLDGQAGANPWDREFIDRLRKISKPMTFAVNKIDIPVHQIRAHPFYECGISEILPISAETGLGLEEFMDRVTEDFLSFSLPEKHEELRIAVVGRPNVGKSSLVNRILGTPRSIVDLRPGTTRDSLDSPFTWRGRSWILIDTAGIRRAGRISKGVEKISVFQARRSIDHSEIVLVLIDAIEGPTEQDARIAGYAYNRGKGIVLLVNKCDLVVADRKRNEILKQIALRCHFLSCAPVHFVSAREGVGVGRIFELIQEVARDHSQWLPTGPLNRVIQDALKKREPKSQGRGRPRVFYATQIAACPPTFLIFVRDPAALHFSYQRYLSNEIQSAFGLKRTPIRIVFRSRRPGDGRNGMDPTALKKLSFSSVEKVPDGWCAGAGSELAKNLL
jgi:GTP-binding protein